MSKDTNETKVVIRDGILVSMNNEAIQALFKAVQDAVKAIILIQATAPDDEKEEADTAIIQFTRILRQKLDGIKKQFDAQDQREENTEEAKEYKTSTEAVPDSASSQEGRGEE